MSKALFITGTGTDTGKTYITGLITKKLAEVGLHPAYYKAAMSGNDRRADGSLIPGDALCVQTMSGITQRLEDMCPYVYEHAYSPHLASRLEGHPVQMNVVKKGFAQVCENYDYVTVEYMKAHDLPLKGIIFNHCHPGNVMEEDNIFMCEHMTGLPTLARVCDGDTSLSIDAATLSELYDEVTL
ncbi:MAG: dethiobiotin synthase [Clostridiaceae bacterium]|nr:dethiobiotin synthase [Clostridiaceae bacterium]